MSAKTVRLGQALTPGEREVLAYIADGKPYLEIALTLMIAPATVASRVNSIRAKLGARNRAHAVGLAMRARVIP